MTNTVELWLSTFSQAIIIFLLVQLSLGIFWNFSKRSISHLHHLWQYSLCWLFVLLPWLISLACIIFMEQNHNLLAQSNILQQYFHWHHRLLFNWNSWHGLSVVFTLLIGSCLLFKAMLIAREDHQKNLKRSVLLEMTSDQHGYFQHPQAMAFTSGLLKPKVYISHTLVEQLSTSELSMVKLHEQSHVTHYDSLQKWLFLFLASFYPKCISRRLMASMTLAMEYRADQAIKKQFEILDIAETLITITRLMRSSSSQLEQRLHYLIAPNNVFWLKKYALPIGLIILQIILPITTLFFCMDFLHHQLDQWLWH